MKTNRRTQRNILNVCRSRERQDGRPDRTPVVLSLVLVLKFTHLTIKRHSLKPQLIYISSLNKITIHLEKEDDLI